MGLSSNVSWRGPCDYYKWATCPDFARHSRIPGPPKLGLFPNLGSTPFVVASDGEEALHSFLTQAKLRNKEEKAESYLVYGACQNVLALQELCQAAESQNLLIPAQWHEYNAAEPGLDSRHHLHPHGPRISLSGGHHRLVYLKAYQDGRDARIGLGNCFRFYNTERPHQAPGYRTPAEVFTSITVEDTHGGIVKSLTSKYPEDSEPQS